MSSHRVKFIFLTANLARTQAFYSTIGIDWLGGQERPLAEPNEPDPMGLPDLAGTLGNVMIWFYLKGTLSQSENAHMTINVELNVSKSVSSIIQQLKSLDLFVPATDFDEQIQSPVLDPDGRRIELCEPTPLDHLLAVTKKLAVKRNRNRG